MQSANIYPEQREMLGEGLWALFAAAGEAHVASFAVSWRNPIPAETDQHCPHLDPTTRVAHPTLPLSSAICSRIQPSGIYSPLAGMGIHSEGGYGALILPLWYWSL